MRASAPLGYYSKAARRGRGNGSLHLHGLHDGDDLAFLDIGAVLDSPELESTGHWSMDRARPCLSRLGELGVGALQSADFEAVPIASWNRTILGASAYSPPPGWTWPPSRSEML